MSGISVPTTEILCLYGALLARNSCIYIVHPVRTLRHNRGIDAIRHTSYRKSLTMGLFALTSAVLHTQLVKHLGAAPFLHRWPK